MYFNDLSPHVVTINKDSEIEIIVSFTCPFCEIGEYLYRWQGGACRKGEKAIYPVFACEPCACRKAKKIDIPQKSVVMWIYKARLEILQCYDEEKNKPILRRSNSAKRAKIRDKAKKQADLNYIYDIGA